MAPSISTRCAWTMSKISLETNGAGGEGTSEGHSRAEHRERGQLDTTSLGGVGWGCGGFTAEMASNVVAAPNPDRATCLPEIGAEQTSGVTIPSHAFPKGLVFHRTKFQQFFSKDLGLEDANSACR